MTGEHIKDKLLDAGRGSTASDAIMKAEEVLGIADELYPEGTELVLIISGMQDDGGKYPWRVYAAG